MPLLQFGDILSYLELKKQAKLEPKSNKTKGELHVVTVSIL